MSMELTQDKLMEILSYDYDSGNFTWKSPTNRSIRVGDIAGTVTDMDYIQIGVLGKLYLAHRLAWLYVYGYFPTEIDHINRNKADNRILNLREVTHSENQKNQKMNSKNTSGFTGVYKHRNGKWVAQIQVGGKSINLGYFHKIENAVATRKNAEIKYKFHKNHGR